MSRFALQVPLDPTYRGLGAEIAAKYAEVLGAAPAEAQALAASVDEAMNTVGDGASADADVALEFVAVATGIEVRVRCGDRSTVVTHPLPAQKR